MVDELRRRQHREDHDASYPYNDYLNQLLLQVRGGDAHAAPCSSTSRGWPPLPPPASSSTSAGAGRQGATTPSRRWASARSDGKQYGIPWTQAGIGLIGELGAADGGPGVTTPPKTIDEFETALRALQGLGDGVVPWAAMTKVDQLKDLHRRGCGRSARRSSRTARSSSVTTPASRRSPGTRSSTTRS